MRGLIMRGLIMRGLIMRGLIMRGLIMRGLIMSPLKNEVALQPFVRARTCIENLLATKKLVDASIEFCHFLGINVGFI